ncbi:MAG: putative colanic acid biosynthesis acetyltransferase [Panacagrimonas sp.]
MILKGVNAYEQASFSLGNRAARVAWSLVYNCVFKWTPRPMHGLRSLLLRLFGARMGRNCHIYPSAKIWAPWNLEMADHACLGDDVYCYSMALIRLGTKAVVSQGTHLCAGTHDYEDPNFQLYALPITIGANACICPGAFVGPGVEIGEGSVVSARSVAMKSMPARMVCAGNPCEPIGARRIRIPAKRETVRTSDYVMPEVVFNRAGIPRRPHRGYLRRSV